MKSYQVSTIMVKAKEIIDETGFYTEEEINFLATLLDEAWDRIAEESNNANT